MGLSLYNTILAVITRAESTTGAESEARAVARGHLAYSEYKHELANILRSRYVDRTPPLETRSPGRRSIVENAPPPSPAGHRPAARAHPSVRPMSSCRGMDARL